MELEMYLIITPRTQINGKQDWTVAAYNKLPSTDIAPTSRVAKLILDIPDSELEPPVIRAKWPDGKPPDDVVAELKEWTT